MDVGTTIPGNAFIVNHVSSYKPMQQDIKQEYTRKNMHIQFHRDDINVLKNVFIIVFFTIWFALQSNVTYRHAFLKLWESKLLQWNVHMMLPYIILLCLCNQLLIRMHQYNHGLILNLIANVLSDGLASYGATATANIVLTEK